MCAADKRNSGRGLVPADQYPPVVVVVVCDVAAGRDTVCSLETEVLVVVGVGSVTTAVHDVRSTGAAAARMNNGSSLFI
ncbi:MAG: hypothetical protein H0U43_01725 [Chthoniobacterales bacterium]|nr:hypothetical protein [Chthoniobacterales bacterium]